MNSNEQLKPSSEESVTFVIKRSSRNIWIAKLLIFLVLTGVGTLYFIQSATQQYKTGSELTQEKYLENFDAYKGSLLSSKQYRNPILATFGMLITFSFLLGSYELLSVIIGLLIGKVIKR